MRDLDFPDDASDASVSERGIKLHSSIYSHAWSHVDALNSVAQIAVSTHLPRAHASTSHTSVTVSKDWHIHA